MSTTLKGHLQALITIAIWSSTFIVSKILLGHMTPLQILLARYLIAIICLSVMYPRFSKPVSLRQEALFLAIGAALAYYFVFENSALQRTYSSNVSLIVATIPFLTGILSMLIYKTRFFNLKSTAGLITAYLGVFLIILNGSRFEGVEPVGDLLALGAAVMFAIYSVLMQKAGHAASMIQMTRKVFLYGLLVLAVTVLLDGQPVIPAGLGAQSLVSLLYLGIVASSLAFILWNRAIRAIGPVKTNQYIYLIPVMTTIVSSLILDERITVMTVLGTVLILSGLYVSEKSRTAAAEPEQHEVM